MPGLVALQMLTISVILVCQSASRVGICVCLAAVGVVRAGLWNPWPLKELGAPQNMAMGPRRCVAAMVLGIYACVAVHWCHVYSPTCVAEGHRDTSKSM